MWKSLETRDLRVHYEASKTMSELESCMLFVGTDFGLRKTVKPLFLKLRRLGQRCSQQLVTGKPFALFLAPSQDTSVSLVVTCINVCMCFALFHFLLFFYGTYILECCFHTNCIRSLNNCATVFLYVPGIITLVLKFHMSAMV